VDGGVKIKPLGPSRSRPLITSKPYKPLKVFDWDSSLTKRQLATWYIQHLFEFVDIKSSNYAFTNVVVDKHSLNFLTFDREFMETIEFVAISFRSYVGLATLHNGFSCIMLLKKHLGKDINSSLGYQAIISLHLVSNHEVSRC